MSSLILLFLWTVVSHTCVVGKCQEDGKLTDINTLDPPPSHNSEKSAVRCVTQKEMCIVMEIACASYHILRSAPFLRYRATLRNSEGPKARLVQEGVTIEDVLV